MIRIILYVVLPSFLFVVTLIEAIKEAVAERKYWPWAVVSSLLLAFLLYMACMTRP